MLKFLHNKEFKFYELEFHVNFLIKKYQISECHLGTFLRNSIFWNLNYV